MADYRLSGEARQDLKSIGRFTQQRWGRAQRVKYLGDLQSSFARIADDGSLGRSRDDLRPNLLSYPSGSHVIFFRRDQGRVVIVRVLHGRQDHQAHLI